MDSSCDSEGQEGLWRNHERSKRRKDSSAYFAIPVERREYEEEKANGVGDSKGIQVSSSGLL